MSLKIDQNRRFLYKYSDPYLSEQKADEQGIYYPRPREFFKYLPKYEYVQRPLFSLNHNISKTSPFSFLENFQIENDISPYERQILQEVYNEALRFSFAYALRNDSLSEIERDYAQKKIQYCEDLFSNKKFFPLLLNLISLVEDAETLTIMEQSDFISFNRGQIRYSEIYNRIEAALKADLDISLEFDLLPPSRDFSDLQNYLDRAEWQAFQSKTKQDDFKQLVLDAQYDRRYLRAVSKTSPKQNDIQLQNHNLPMILLFREALEITKNNKKAAVALLNEAIRIPNLISGIEGS
jgi:hypothetical protein